MPWLRLWLTDGTELVALRNTVADLSGAIHRLTRDVDYLINLVAESSFITQHTQGEIMADLQEIEDAVRQNGEVAASAVTLIEGLADRLDDIDTTDPAALANLSAELRAQSAALADAVVANTPEDPGAGDDDGGVVDDGGGTDEDGEDTPA